MGNENNVFVSLTPMIYMIIVGRLNADGAFLICIHHFAPSRRRYRATNIIPCFL